MFYGDHLIEIKREKFVSFLSKSYKLIRSLIIRQQTNKFSI